MKRLLQILVPLAILFSACSKEKSLELNGNDPNTGGPGTGGPGTGGPNTGYYIKCKVGGVAKTFNVGAAAISETDAGVTETAVGGKANDNPQDFESISFSITSPNALANGTYKVDDISGDYEIFAAYLPNSQTIGYLTISGLPFGSPFKINITSISSTEIAGTFSGTMIEVDVTNPQPSPNPVQKLITEGEFKVKFQ